MSTHEKTLWLDKLCEDHHIVNTGVLTTPQLELWLKQYNQKFGGSCTLESFKRRLRGSKRTYLTKLGMLEEGELQEDVPVEKDVDEEIIESNVKYQKQKQKFQDTNRIERKSFREYARVENAVSEYAQEIVKLLKTYGDNLYTPTKFHDKITHDGEVGLIQVTDTHFNELIDLAHNKYDMSIASCRLYKLYKEAIHMFRARSITKIVVAFTGDLLNSDRRLDELLNQATNRAKATFVSVELIKQFLLSLTYDFDVSVVSVLGNESRVGKEMPFSNEVLSDNYDFTIINMVRLLFEGSGTENISFGSLDEVETIIEINDQKILLSHDIPKATATAKGTQSVIGMKYLQGTPVDYYIGGHIHQTQNQVFGFRSGSLCGSNSYSDNALHLAGKASQNIYFVGKNYLHSMSVDLQNYNEEEWFNIDDALMEYHAKSVEKTRSKETVISIVI